MKRDFLRDLDLGNGARLPDAAIEAIMAEHGNQLKYPEGRDGGGEITPPLPAPCPGAGRG